MDVSPSRIDPDNRHRSSRPAWRPRLRSVRALVDLDNRARRPGSLRQRRSRRGIRPAFRVTRRSPLTTSPVDLGLDDDPSRWARSTRAFAALPSYTQRPHALSITPSRPALRTHGSIFALCSTAARKRSLSRVQTARVDSDSSKDAWQTRSARLRPHRRAHDAELCSPKRASLSAPPPTEVSLSHARRQVSQSRFVRCTHSPVVFDGERLGRFEPRPRTMYIPYG